MNINYNQLVGDSHPVNDKMDYNPKSNINKKPSIGGTPGSANQGSANASAPPVLSKNASTKAKADAFAAAQ
jgi:hypothetical protein